MDAFTRGLWNIYETVHREGVSQKLQLGIHRSDYMFDVGDAGQDGDPSAFRLTQIEINTIASAFGALSTRLFATHQRILRRFNETLLDGKRFQGEAVPRNQVSENLARGMIYAVDQYRRARETSKSKSSSRLAILFLDTEVTRNIFDQRQLEFAINDQSEDIVVLRKTLREAELNAKLDEKTRILTVDGFEIALAYFRVGYSPDHYPSGESQEIKTRGYSLLFRLKMIVLAFRL